MTYLIALFAMPFDDNTWSAVVAENVEAVQYPCTKSALVQATTCTTSPFIAFAAKVIVVELVVV